MRISKRGSSAWSGHSMPNGHRGWLIRVVLALELALGMPTWGQVPLGGIRGSVSDAEFGGAAAQAVVQIVELNRSQTTSEDGHFLIEGVPPGTYTLTVTKSGYERRVEPNVTVTAGLLAELVIELKGEFTDMEELTVRDLELTDTASESGLLNLRRNTLSFQDSISKDLMNRAGAGDAASVLKLVVGASVVDGKYATVRGMSDRYVGVAVNGMRVPSSDPKKRAVQLDIFPSGTIESMTVSKTFTPDLPGDYSGGGVNIRTISIPDKAFVKFSTTREQNGTWTGKDGFVTYEGAGCGKWGRDLGSRAIPAGVDSIILNPILTRNLRLWSYGYDLRTKNEYDSITRSVSPVMGVKFAQVPDGNYGYSLGVGDRWDVGQGWTAGWLGAYTYSQKYAERDSEDSVVSIDPGGSRSPNDGDYHRRVGSQDVKTSALASVGMTKGDEQGFGFTWLRTQSATDRASIMTDDRFPYTMAVNEEPVSRVQGIEYSERSLDARQLTWRRKWDTFDVELFGSHNIVRQYEPDLRRFKELLYHPDANTWESQLSQASAIQGNFDHSRFWRDVKEDNTQYGVNLTQHFKFNDADGQVRTGWLEDMTHRSYAYDAVIYRNISGGSFTMTDPNLLWTDTFFGQPPYQNPMQWYLQPLPYAPANVQYTAEQDLPAGYVMLDCPVAPKLKALFGVRCEVTDMTISPFNDFDANGYSNYLTIPSDGSSVNLDQISFVGKNEAQAHLQDAQWLRSVGLVYEIMPKMNLRINWSQTVARPTFRELAPVLSVDPVDGDNYFGNKDLKVSKVQNDDVRWEWFRKPGEVWAVSWFYKKVQDPIEKITFGYYGDQYVYALNYPEGRVAGMEYEVKKNLDEYVPLPIGSLNVGANYTIMESTVTIPETTANRLTQAYNWKFRQRSPKDMFVSPFNLFNQGFIFDFFNMGDATDFSGAQRDMEGQPAYLFNFNLGYDIDKWGTSFNWFYNIRGDMLKTGASESVSGDFAAVTPDIYLKKLATVNVSLSQKLGGHWKLTLAAQNLLDSAFQETYRIPGQKDIARRSYREGVWYSANLTTTW